MKQTAKKKDIVTFLNKFLDVTAFKDYGINGLQIDGKNEVSKISFGVDASLELFNKSRNSNMIIVHHGLFWDKIGPIVGESYYRIKTLLENNTSLYASHAPLDRHKIAGNNANILKLFGLKPKNDFGFDNIYWGYSDNFKIPVRLESCISTVKKFSPTPSMFLFGKKMIKSIGVVSGGASFAIKEAAEKNIDLLIIGEIKHSDYHIAKEGNVNVIAAGHYLTETFGVKALMPIVKKRFGIETEFVDIPTGL